TPDLRDDRHRVRQAGRPAQQWAFDLGPAEALAARDDLQLAVVGADCTRPRLGPVDEHAVGEGHPAEPDLLFAHEIEVSYRAPSRRRLGGAVSEAGRLRRPAG